MPYGPNKEWRPVAIGACAVHVCKIATGEISETYAPPKSDSSPATRQRASVAGKARAAAMTPAERSVLGRAGAQARWGVAADDSSPYGDDDGE